MIDEIEVLPMLFGRVLIPSAVLEELLDARNPIKAAKWAEQLPEWIETGLPVFSEDGSLQGLGAGEREAIQLALDRGIKRVLIDETKGRAVARGHELQVEGTLGILDRAAGLGMSILGRHSVSWS